MRIIAAVIVLCVVVGVLAVVVVRGTVDSRAEEARATLERGAKRFVACYDRDGSYLKCKAGSKKIAITFRRSDAFSLTYAADFAATYTISRDKDGELQRSCQPRGKRCPVGDWSG